MKLNQQSRPRRSGLTADEPQTTAVNRGHSDALWGEGRSRGMVSGDLVSIRLGPLITFTKSSNRYTVGAHKTSSPLPCTPVPSLKLPAQEPSSRAPRRLPRGESTVAADECIIIKQTLITQPTWAFRISCKQMKFR